MRVYPEGIRVLINIFTVIVVFAAWAKMFFDTEGGMLASSGIKSLKYFTVLSNIFEGIASLCWLFAALGPMAIGLADRLKFMACMSVSLTFFTVMCFLGPVHGYQYMFEGANLYFHLIIPVLAILEFILMNRTAMTVGDALMSLVPMLIYCVGYIGNIVRGGLEGNDWYGFFAWGIKVGIILNVIMGLVMFGLANVYRLLNMIGR